MRGFPKDRPKLLDKLQAAKDRVDEWKKRRAQVRERDGSICRICRERPWFDLHHLLARSLGGRDVLHNLIGVCRECHRLIHGHVVKLRWTDDGNRAKTLRIERIA